MGIAKRLTDSAGQLAVIPCKIARQTRARTLAANKPVTAAGAREIVAEPQPGIWTAVADGATVLRPERRTVAAIVVVAAVEIVSATAVFPVVVRALTIEAPLAENETAAVQPEPAVRVVLPALVVAVVPAEAEVEVVVADDAGSD